MHLFEIPFHKTRFPESVTRSLLNKMAQRQAEAHYVVAQRHLAAELSEAELRGRADELLSTWLGQLQDRGGVRRADVCTS